jgi:hypothetical protein
MIDEHRIARLFQLFDLAFEERGVLRMSELDTPGIMGVFVAWCELGKHSPTVRLYHDANIGRWRVLSFGTIDVRSTFDKTALPPQIETASEWRPAEVGL